MENYDFIEKIGRGVYSNIYKVLNVQDGKFYAQKNYLPDLNTESSGLQSGTIVELEILRKTSHPNIIAVKEILINKSRVCAILELKHKNLLAYLRSSSDNSLNPSQRSLKIMNGLLNGLHYLHRNHIIHRDLKPENILLNEECEPIISDFGLSCLIFRKEIRYDFEVVTITYRAPELLAYKPQEKTSDKAYYYTNKIDVWSLGVIFLDLFDLNRIDGAKG